VRVFAYVYPGWHPIPERDESFYPGFTEWDLVYDSGPRFDGHVQPRLPLWGRYDDRDPVAVERRIALCRDHGVDGWVYGFFWCRGKRVFQDALDLGFLGAASGDRYPFALMWANRMPRRVLPVRRTDTPVIEADRLVPADVDDFCAFVRYVAERYWVLAAALADMPRFGLRRSFNAGVFGYQGPFRLEQYGAVFFVATNRERLVALARRDRTPLLISPARPRDFVEDLRDVLAKQPATDTAESV